MTTPVTGAIAGFKALGVKRIALLTPYIDPVNRLFRRFVQRSRHEVPVIGSFNHENDNDVARISGDSIRRAALELGKHPSVDAVFVSCTSIRLAETAKALEAELGKPVTSSNHAMAGMLCAWPVSPSRCRNGAGCLRPERQPICSEPEAADVLAAGHAFDVLDLGVGELLHEAEVEGADFRMRRRQLVEHAVRATTSRPRPCSSASVS